MGQLRVMVAATEFPGHAFAEFALAGALRARGHEVLLETSERWREAVGGLDVEVAAVEDVGGVRHHGTFDDDLVRAARRLVPVVEEFGPDVVVSDLATAAPPLAAELTGTPTATVVATMYPVEAPGLPPYPLGLHPPRTALGKALWRALGPPLSRVRPRARRLREVATELGVVREKLGLPAIPPGQAISSYGSISERLTMVATFPQLEYPRSWPAHVHLTGPMVFEHPAERVELPGGDQPLVVVVASTAQDPGQELLRVALDALADERVRVVATTSGQRRTRRESLPENARVVEWISSEQIRDEAALVLTRGGHGTVVGALASGVPLLVCPVAGDMPENGARVAWAGAGLMLPRPLLAAGPLRSTVRRLLAEPAFRSRAAELAAWHRRNDGAVRGAELIEEGAGEGR